MNNWNLIEELSTRKATPATYAVALVLARYGRTSFVVQKTLAEKANVSIRTVGTALQWLESEGLLEMKLDRHTKKGLAYTYTFTDLAVNGVKVETISTNEVKVEIISPNELKEESISGNDCVHISNNTSSNKSLNLNKSKFRDLETNNLSNTYMYEMISTNEESDEADALANEFFQAASQRVSTPALALTPGGVDAARTRVGREFGGIKRLGDY